MKVALVCDWLTEIGGAERVLKSISDIFPDAPIYTSQYRPARIDWFKDRNVITGWLNFFPAKFRRILGPLRQIYFQNLNLSNYDIIISVTGAEAKAIKKGHAKHICYCHVPTQYYWQFYEKYLANPGFGFLNPLVRLMLKILIKPLRRADYNSAQLPDEFITISNYAKDQIKKYYNRESTIIYPPVAVAKFADLNNDAKINNCNQNHFINFSRQVTWKRLDLAILACLKTGDKLTLIGDGPEHKHLVKLAGGAKNILFLPQMPQASLKKHLKLADGYIFPSLEPFGIAPIEAMSAGCPVIAYAVGGSSDYILENQNGITFKSQTVNSLASALRNFNKTNFNIKTIKSSVQKFSESRFQTEIKKIVKEQHGKQK